MAVTLQEVSSNESMKVELRKKSALTTCDSPVKPVEALVMKCRYLKMAELQVAKGSGN